MKKFMCIILACVLLLTFFGCGENKNAPENTKNAETNAENKGTDEELKAGESKSLSGIALGVMGVIGKTYGEIRDMSGAPGQKVENDGSIYYKFNGSDALYAFGEPETEDTKAEKKDDLKSAADTNDISDGAKCTKAVCKVEDIMKLGGESYSVMAVEQYVNVSFKEKSKTDKGFKLVYENNFMEVTFYSEGEDSLKGNEKAVVTVK